MKNTYEGKVAIVTGASSGIGKATAAALARTGYKVFGTSRRATRDGPPGVVMLNCDVIDEGSVKQLISDVLAQAGRIDLLVNNAGIGLVGGAEEFSIAQAQAVFDVNLFGVMRATNAVLPSMRKQGGGRIINISSALGFLPAPFSAYYSSSKHALEGYSESLDHEVRAFGVRVSLIEPAFTRSNFDQGALRPDSRIQEYDQPTAAMDAHLKQALMAGDPPEVVADTVVLAATAARPKARYPAGKQAKQLSVLRRILPAGVLDKSLRKQFGLPV